MSLINLSDIFETMVWHEQSEHEHHPGIFIKLPRELASQFPRKPEDKSPPHITVCMLETVNSNLEHKLLRIVQEVCSQFKPFLIKIGKVKKFNNNKGEIVLYSSMKSSKLIRFHDEIKKALMSNQFAVDNTYPEYIPHTTIAYIKDRKELKQYKDIVPQGEFMLKEVWIWGTDTPYLITLGK